MPSGYQLVAPQTADTVACQRCGASFRIEALAPTIQCPFCRHHQAISPEQLAHLAAYGREIGAQYAAADEHAQHLAGWRQWHGDSKSGSNLGVGTFFVFFAIFAVVSGGLGAVLAWLEIIKWVVIPTFVIMGGFTLGTIVFYGIYFYRLARRGEVKAERAGVVVVACPSCGAPGELTPGEALDHCTHCRAPLVPTRAIMDQAIDAVSQARRRAAIERYRTEREAMVQIAARTANNALPYLVLGPFSIMITIAAVAFTKELLLGETEARPEGLAILWLFVFGMWGVMLTIFVLRRHRRAQTDAALDHLARQFHGQRLGGIRATAQWLNSFWAGPFGIEQFYVGPGYGAAALRMGPYLALLDYNPNGAQNVKRRVQLLVAAWVPGASEGRRSTQVPPAARGLSAELAREGWEVELQEGGLVMRATAPLNKRLRDPDALHSVAPAVDRAFRLVSAAGGQPVTEI
jgi:hypothetical protein